MINTTANVPNPAKPFHTPGAIFAATTPATILNKNAITTITFVFQLLLLMLSLSSLI